MTTAADMAVVRPGYEGHSLVNLMTTLTAHLGGVPLSYAPLAAEAGAAAIDLRDIRQVVLLVVDGLGDDLLASLGAGSALARHRVARLTSVFPSTTASAIPTFLTGLAPQQHALIGWHMWFAEIDRLLAVLPLSPRDPSPPPDPQPVPLDAAALPGLLFEHRPLATRLPGACFCISPRKIAGSPFNRYHTSRSQTLPYGSAAEMFALIEALVASRPQRDGSPPDYIHAYYSDLDSVLHVTGTRHERVATLFAELDRLFAQSLQRLQGSGTLMIVTADHGFIDAPAAHLIELDSHPDLTAMLARPLCGERRVAYAYVKPGFASRFETYVTRNLGHACRLVRTPEFVAEGWFGPGVPHPRLAARAGDYVLLMRDDWTIKDWLPGEKRFAQPGVHGGASALEMRVPLLVARC